MRLMDYIKDKYKEIILSILSILMIILILLTFKVSTLIIFFITFILLINFIIIFIYNFLKRKIFYNNTKKILDGLDKKYLITEIIKEPNFIEGKIFLDCLYEIDKSMLENVNKYKNSSKDFIEYIELWCHEIKTPLACADLITENNINETTISIKEELDKIDYFIEQVLYYVRSGNVEKDYIIKKTDLRKIVESVIKKNKKNFINRKIKVKINDLSVVDTDSKWIEFIINQIISNSIKYCKDKNASIEIYSKENKNNVVLYIEDNGIGIEESEIERVFDKCFTGSNGRKKYKSTGIGLYLCKKLCDKLGHKIEIASILNEKTTVSLIFPKSSMISKIR